MWSQLYLLSAPWPQGSWPIWAFVFCPWKWWFSHLSRRDSKRIRLFSTQASWGAEWTPGIPGLHPLWNRIGLSGFEIQQFEGPLPVKVPQQPWGSLKDRQHMEDLGSDTDPGPVNCGPNSRNTGSTSLKLHGSGLAPCSPDKAFRNGRHLGIAQFSL